MIIDINGLKQFMLEKRSEAKNSLEYNMVFENGSFVPKIASGNEKVNIAAYYTSTNKGAISIAELAGLCIVEKSGDKSTPPAALTSNGLFVNVTEVKATEVFLVSSYKDAVNIIENIHKFATTNHPIKPLSVFVAYQRDRAAGLHFEELKVK